MAYFSLIIINNRDTGVKINVVLRNQLKLKKNTRNSTRKLNWFKDFFLQTCEFQYDFFFGIKSRNFKFIFD